MKRENNNEVLLECYIYIYILQSEKIIHVVMF